MFYLRPLVQNQNKLGVTPEEIKSLFCNFEAITTFHQIMAHDLQLQEAGAVFLKNAPFLRMYTEFVSAYDTCMDTLDKLKKRRKIRSFFDNIRKKTSKATGNLKLEDFLIMPVQRIPRYELLLSNLRKHADRHSPEFSKLDQALKLIQSIAVEGKK